MSGLLAQATGDGLLVQTFDALRDQASYRGTTGITARVVEHIRISVVPVVVAVLLAVPVSLWLGHKRRFGLLVINVSNVGRAVPSFAILVIGNELMGRQEQPVIGIVAVFLALVALAVPPIVTNTYVGVAEVPDDVRDAARGMGLSEGQILRRVEIPLAIPLIMTGIRTSAVQVVATATIAAQLGAGGLGRFIIDGFATRRSGGFVDVIVGALLVALLALATDLLLGGVQRLLTPRGLRTERAARRRTTTPPPTAPPAADPDPVPAPTTTTERDHPVITTRRRLAALLLVPLFALVAVGCTDSDDDGDTSSDPGSEAPDDTGDTGDEAAAEFTFTPLDAGGPLTKGALENGDIDIALLFSSDGAIAANEWVALEDDQDLQPADNFVPAIRTEASNDDIAAVLDAVNAGLTVEDVQALVAQVAIDGDNPEDAAATWLDEQGLPGDLTAEGTIDVGSSNFAESSIAAQLYGQALAAAGVDVSYTPDIGARDVYWEALVNGDVDLVPEFTGTLLTFLDDTAAATPDVDEVLAALRPLAEAEGVTILEPAAADSVNVFVVTSETAEEYDLTTVSDLADVPDPLVLGGPPECPERPYCLLGLIETYGLRFAD